MNEVEMVGSYPPTVKVPGMARRLLGDAMGRAGVPEPPREIVLLLATELVTNAVVHARTALEVRIRAGDDRVRVEVADRDSRQPAPVLSPLMATGGRGLHLVASLAQQWGTTSTDEGKIVWFELPIAS